MGLLGPECYDNGPGCSHEQRARSPARMDIEDTAGGSQQLRGHYNNAVPVHRISLGDPLGNEIDGSSKGMLGRDPYHGDREKDYCKHQKATHPH